MVDLNVVQTLIVGHLWQSVALAAVLAGGLILGRRMRGSTRYGLAGVAFAACLALPLAAFIPGEALVTGLLDKLNAPQSVAEKAEAAPEQSSIAAENGVPAWVTNLSANAINNVVPAGVKPSETFWGKQAVKDGAPEWAINLGAGAIRNLGKPVVAPTPPAPKPMFTFPEIKIPNLNLPDLTLPLGLIWLAGALIMLVRTGRDLIAVERLVARARPADLPEALKRRMKGVRVAVSPEAPGPMAAGLFRPCIVLPENVALGSPGMAALLEHERAHIERRDMLAALGQRIVLALLWWSPALYWISRRVDEEREVACDETAVDRTGDAKAFARSLTTQAENQLWARAPRLAVGAIGPRSHVGRRVRRLIEIAKGASPAKYAGRLAFAVLALAVAVAAMVTPRFAANAQESPQSENRAIDLTSREARDEARARAQEARDEARVARDAARASRDDELAGPQTHHDDYAALGDEISALMDSLGPEIEAAMAGLSPELQGELAGLSAEMSQLGVEIGLAVSDQVLAELPQIMDQVREELKAQGIDIDNLDDVHGLSEEDREEIREALQEAREQIQEQLGPEVRQEIRAAIEEARADLASHKEEIRAAIEESRAGMAIAREAVAKARAEIDAARARGDFDKYDKFRDGDFNLDFDFDQFDHINKDVIEKLKAQGIDIRNSKNIRVRVDGDDSLAERLYSAARHCRTDEVKRLIKEEKADVNAVIRGDGTALIAASRYNCIEAVRILLDAGADANLASSGDGNPLIMAAGRGHMDVARLLIDRGAKVNGFSSGDGSPLIAAAGSGRIEMARLLIDRGANVNGYVPGDETPLMSAAEQGKLEMAKLLVDRGAKVNLAYNVETRGGATELRSPLNMAQRHGNDEVAAYLRSKGAVAEPKPAN